MLSPKGATCGILYRQLDYSFHFSARIIASYLPTTPASTPNIALAVNRKAIWDTGFIRGVNKKPTIFDSAARRVKIIHVNHMQRRIGEIHEFVIRAPADTVGYLESRFHRVNRTIWIEAVKRALWLFTHVGKSAHGSCPETAPAIDCTIVKAGVRFMCLGVRDQAQPFLLIPKSEPVFRRHNQAARRP